MAASKLQQEIRLEPHHRMPQEVTRELHQRMLWNMVSPPLALAEPAAEELAPDDLLKNAERFMLSLQPSSDSLQGSLCGYAE